MQILHLGLLAGMVLTPFLGSVPMLLLHAVAAPGILLHWWLNNDTCFLTVVESWLRGVPKPDSFMDMLAGGVYRLPRSVLSPELWKFGLFVLWLVTLSRLLISYR